MCIYTIFTYRLLAYSLLITFATPLSMLPSCSLTLMCIDNKEERTHTFVCVINSTMIGEKILVLTFSSLTGIPHKNSCAYNNLYVFLSQHIMQLYGCLCWRQTQKYFFRSTFVPEDRNMRCFVCVAVTHSGEEHGEDVDRSLQQVMASDGDGHRRDEHQVTETEQQGGEQLEAVGVCLRIICAPPALPA